MVVRRATDPSALLLELAPSVRPCGLPISPLKREGDDRDGVTRLGPTRLAHPYKATATGDNLRLDDGASTMRGRSSESSFRAHRNPSPRVRLAR